MIELDIKKEERAEFFKSLAIYFRKVDYPEMSRKYAQLAYEEDITNVYQVNDGRVVFKDGDNPQEK